MVIIDELSYSPILSSEAREFLALKTALDGETKFMMLEPGERALLGNGEEELEQIQRAEAGRDFLMAARADGEMAGYLSAERGAYRRIWHTAYVVVGVRAGYRGKGIGTELFRRLDAWARESGIRRLELTVLRGNEAAKRLYEAAGFVVEGIRRGSMCVDGEDTDEYYMAKYVSGGNGTEEAAE